MRPYRLTLALLVAAGLSPGILWRDEPVRDYQAPVEIVPLDHGPVRAGPLVLDKAWEFRSENDALGGYSALILGGSGQIVAGSDAGRLLFVTREGDTLSGTRLDHFVAGLDRDKLSVDIESMTVDPSTGRVWAGFENTNAIQRYSANFEFEAEVFPAPIAGWSENSGPESMARLPDGRFLLIAEQRSGGVHPAVLFEGDPTLDGVEYTELTYEGLDGYRPVDLAVLPDGRALILMRSFSLGLPPRFGTAIMIADPAQIRPGETWQSETLAELGPSFPSENYEGIAVEEAPEGKVNVWLISDDNFASYQRTLLLKLGWQPDKSRARQKARE
ncbi:esterase-like activity of phytase family protein [Qipengyuania aquimaris]|uniref:esterase-like activity of phytase family protein n=1 Tax=Qipengyuania aquimaris TaxID=255984 RepID=UPI001FD42613|nr:esterase-like activity of phytase family protein [Qipengyuania aquimaris]UOR16097.1 esterase-like activity of phytase family protein [Qipengyuania aquimaris]